MAKDIFISVIVPVYNVKPFLKDCLDSLLFQTKEIDEIIIINDGSTDGSGEICEDYCKKNDNIVLIEQDNQGLSSARNKGLKNARGKYVVFVDSDDYVNTNMNFCLCNFLKDREVDILYYDADILDETREYHDPKSYVRSEYLHGYGMSGIEFFEKSYLDNYIVSACLAAYKKSFLDYNNIAFPVGLHFEDNVFFIQSVLNAKKVQCISERLYIRRYRSGSIITSQKTLNKCLDHIEVFRRIYGLLYTYEYKAGYRDLYKCYLSKQTLAMSVYIKEFRFETCIQEKMGKLIDIFWRYWGNLFVENLNWNDIYLLITFIFYLQQGTEVYNSIINTIYAEIFRKLSRLPLNQANRKIGIYGIGQHTEKLMTLYERYVAKICCDLYFIETQKHRKVYMGKQVVGCNQISKDTDAVIVSSLLYGNEMLKELQNCGIKKDKIILLYNNDDKLDLVQIANLFDEQFKKK